MGRWLDVDPYGRPHAPFDQGRCGLLADGWRAVVVVHKGDEKYIQKAYRTSHGAVSRNICIQCRATNEPGQLLYSHHGPNAFHRCTRLTTEEFIRDVCGVGNWVRLPGFHISFVQHDWLHVVDLTLVPECSASALVELVGQHVWSGGTSDERLRKAYVDFIKACKQAKIRSRGRSKRSKGLKAASQAVALQPDDDVERSVAEFVPKIAALQKKAEALQKKDLKLLAEELFF
eukprot:symbB.v1.2.018608.t1/scaffold1492.1/size116918/3